MILLHTQSILFATVDSQCLEYLGYIILLCRSIKADRYIKMFGKSSNSECQVLMDVCTY